MHNDGAASESSYRSALREFGVKLAAIAMLGMLEKRAVSLGVARLQSEEFPPDFNAGQVILPYLLTAFVQEKQRLLAFLK
jgi:hypothetical protein